MKKKHASIFSGIGAPEVAADVRGGKKKRKGKTQLSESIGASSQLNPRFVLEMMGFKPDHCDSAFEKIVWDIYQKKKLTKSFQKRTQHGEMKQSKQQATQ